MIKINNSEFNMEDFEISKNVCLICGKPAVSGLLPSSNDDVPKIYYSCQDHYLDVYNKYTNPKI